MLVGLGRVFGPAIGGFLAQPAIKYPSVFRHWLWVHFPYLLPCLFAALLGVLLTALVYTHMEETLQHPLPLSLLFASRARKEEAERTRARELKTLKKLRGGEDGEGKPFLPRSDSLHGNKCANPTAALLSVLTFLCVL